MKTTIDLVGLIFGILDSSATLKSEISGSLYQFDSRPAGSDVEDIVINSITVQDGIIQSGVANINVHVPDKNVAGDMAVYKVPNTERLGIITNIIKQLLGDTKGMAQGTTGLYISGFSNPIKEDELDEHYINIRVSAEMHNQIYY